MSIDIPAVTARLKMVLPPRWFADSSPVLDAVLTGFASAWVGLFSLLDETRKQGRIASASDVFLDMAALDYFGDAMPRRTAEADVAYSARIQNNLLSPRATRASVARSLLNLTGRLPVIFEPRNTADTGGYGVNAGYGVSGGYGSMALPYQFFVKAYRPDNLPVGNASGYVTGPGGYNTAPAFYAETSQFHGNISDGEIFANIATVIPTTSIAWTKISN